MTALNAAGSVPEDVIPEATRGQTRPFVVGPNDGEATWFLGTRMVIKATAQSTGGTFGLLENRLAAGFSPPLHIHHQEDESFWILEGKLTLVCDGQTYQAGPGSFVYLPRDLPHTFRVDGGPARVLELVQPGGHERFYVEGGRPALDDSIPEIDPRDFERIGALLAKYRLEEAGPPLQAAG
jgi:mannose-6-phosphate isomerase-like protein (cupin superfamily)